MSCTAKKNTLIALERLEGLEDEDEGEDNEEPRLNQPRLNFNCYLIVLFLCVRTWVKT